MFLLRKMTFKWILLCTKLMHNKTASAIAQSASKNIALGITQTEYETNVHYSNLHKKSETSVECKISCNHAICRCFMTCLSESVCTEGTASSFALLCRKLSEKGNCSLPRKRYVSWCVQCNLGAPPQEILGNLLGREHNRIESRTTKGRTFLGPWNSCWAVGVSRGSFRAQCSPTLAASAECSYPPHPWCRPEPGRSSCSPTRSSQHPENKTIHRLVHFIARWVSKNKHHNPLHASWSNNTTGALRRRCEHDSIGPLRISQE